MTTSQTDVGGRTQTERGPSTKITGSRRQPFVSKESAPREKTGRTTPAQKAKQLLEAVRRCRTRVQGIESTFREDTYTELQEVCVIVAGFQDTKQAYMKFIAERFWRECKRKKPGPADIYEDMVLFTLRFVYDVTSTEGPRYNRVYKYARTLCVLAAEGVSPEDIAEALVEKGTEYAFSFEQDQNAPEDKQPGGGPLDGEELRDDETSGKPPRLATNSSRGKGSTASGSSGNSSGSRPVLEVDVPVSDLGRVLDLPIGGRAQIVVERVGGPPGANRRAGFKRIVAREVRIL